MAHRLQGGVSLNHGCSPARGRGLNSLERDEASCWGTDGVTLGSPNCSCPAPPGNKRTSLYKAVSQAFPPTHPPECSSFLISFIGSYPSISGHWFNIRTSVKKKKDPIIKRLVMLPAGETFWAREKELQELCVILLHCVSLLRFAESASLLGRLQIAFAVLHWFQWQQQKSSDLFCWRPEPSFRLSSVWGKSQKRMQNRLETARGLKAFLD